MTGLYDLKGLYCSIEHPHSEHLVELMLWPQPIWWIKAQLVSRHRTSRQLTVRGFGLSHSIFSNRMRDVAL